MNPQQNQNYWQPTGEEPAIAPVPELITWQASDSIDRQKGVGWFVGLTIATVALAVLFFWLGDWFLGGGIVVLGVIVGVVATRKPKTLNYKITGTGIDVEGKVYNFDQFQSFSVANEQGIHSVILTPNVRFVPVITMYFEEQDGEKIVDALSRHLPLLEHKPDVIEQISRRFRL